MPTPPDSRNFFCMNMVWLILCIKIAAHLELIKYAMEHQEQTVPANRKINNKVQTILNYI